MNSYYMFYHTLCPALMSSPGAPCSQGNMINNGRIIYRIIKTFMAGLLFRFSIKHAGLARRARSGNDLSTIFSNKLCMFQSEFSNISRHIYIPSSAAGHPSGRFKL